jgi:hypothetical protein
MFSIIISITLVTSLHMKFDVSSISDYSIGWHIKSVNLRLTDKILLRKIFRTSRRCAMVGAGRSSNLKIAASKLAHFQIDSLYQITLCHAYSS